MVHFMKHVVIPMIVETHPNFCVQIPIMPQSGIMIVTTLVTTNLRGREKNISDVGHRRSISPTILLVEYLKYRWIYQNPSVAAVEVIACARPR